MHISFEFLGWSVALIATCLAASGLTGLSSSLGLKPSIWPGALTALLLLALISAVAIVSPPSAELSLSSGKITALIYREAYQYDSNGERVEHAEGWFLRVGQQAPAEIKTTVSGFAADGTNQTFVNYPGNPGATMRGSMQGISQAPQQICTGDCDGIAQIPDATIIGYPGITIADWSRVQSAQIGAPALDSVETVSDTPAISTGTWCLSIGFGIFISANLRRILRWIAARSVRGSSKVIVVNPLTPAARRRASPQK